jgi:hypothetical protein
VARVARDGTVLYGSYFGGDNNDGVSRIAVDENDAIYLLGTTGSSDFPFSQSSTNPLSPFLVKIGADGTWTFALRLPSGVMANQVRAGGGGEIVLAGECTPGAVPWSAKFYTAKAPRTSGACYIRLAPNGTDIVASTIVAGANEALANDLVLDASGNAWLTGKSFPADFPITSHSWISTAKQTFYDFTIFAAGVSRDGKTLLASSMFNGEGYEDNPHIAVAPDGIVVIAGTTDSAHFPVTPGAIQTVRLGEIYDHNLFVVELTPDMSAPVFSTYLTGEGEEQVVGLRADGDGSVTLIGNTSSTMFPTTADGQERCLMSNYYPTPMPYVAQLAADGSSLVYSSFVNVGPAGAYLGGAAGSDIWVLGLAGGSILSIDPASPPAEPRFCAMNAANFLGTGVVPGEILTVFGAGLSDAQILVDGRPAKTLYQAEGQMNAIVPDGLTPGATVKVQAVNDGGEIGSIDLAVVSDAAGLFRDFGTPFPVANNDDGTAVDAANPAKPGSIVRVYGTGFGNTQPVIRIGPTIAPPISMQQADGVTEFRVQVPPSGMNELMIDFSITGTFFQATGLKLPVTN